MAQVKDPVCGMMVDSEDAEAESTYQGTTYYFCSEDCKETFDANPVQYVKAGSATAGTKPGKKTPSDSPEGDRWGSGGSGMSSGRSDSSQSSGTSKEPSKSAGSKGQNPGRGKTS